MDLPSSSAQVGHIPELIHLISQWMSVETKRSAEKVSALWKGNLEWDPYDKLRAFNLALSEGDVNYVLEALEQPK